MIEILRKRRSCRQFSKQAIEAEKTAILKEAALRSPTSRNLKPWHFIFIDDPDILGKLGRAKSHGAAFVAQASLGIIITGDEEKSDTWIEDCSIASIILQLTAQTLGLGSCWCQIRLRPHDDTRSAEDYVQELLGLKTHQRVESIIGIGYPAAELRGRDVSELDFSQVV